MKTLEYVESIHKRYQLGNATEHTFRGDLQQLIESLVPDIRATNEPKRQACGAPDYILTKNDIPIGFIEAKDIGDKDLDGLKKVGNKEQFDRYKLSLHNLIFTDYIHFHLYRNGQLVTKIAIAEITDKGIMPIVENFANFEHLIKNFCIYVGQTIQNPRKLAEMLAVKARLLAEVIEKSLLSDDETQENSTLKDQLIAFREILIHDITAKSFADVYAQTIAYGMFAARYHDPTLPTFSRQEAFELIPKSNPFLKKLFGYIAGLDLDDRIKWIVDSLVDIFLATDVAEILTNFNNIEAQHGLPLPENDPIIHFYETFLSEYDPALRKARGVWYTPQPIVNFIVRAVDDILKTEFGLSTGLNENVQILDPATGTGTFLAEIVKHIYKNFENQHGIWSNYVETNLLPRLNGFELLMASYAMAHLKLDLLFSETGFKPTSNQRFRVFLTNSLEEHHPDTHTLFASWLSDEANAANHIKRETPLMVILGNPPYAVSSSNKSEWIQNLIVDYKKNLNETKINLDDDYIKFIRLGEYFIEKQGSGVLAYISNNSFIDGITHRQMRKHLLETFDKVYILDLHGNARKKEKSPEGLPDQNVFDIMQGVSINIFVKTGKKQNELGDVYHFDLQGNRRYKYDVLLKNNLESIAFNKVEALAPYYFFVPKNFTEIVDYEKGFQTKRDIITIHFSTQEANKTVEYIRNNDEDSIRKQYKLPNDGRDWNIKDAKKDVLKSTVKILSILYRPFDFRKIIYTGKTKGIVAYPRDNTSKHIVKGDNLSLITLRLNGENQEFVCLLTQYLIEKGSLAKGNYSFFPLYLYPDSEKEREHSEYRENLELKLEEAKVIFENFKSTFSKIKKMYESAVNPDKDVKQYYKEQEKHYQKLSADIERFKKQLETTSYRKIFEDEARKPNLNLDIVHKIADNLGLMFTPEKQIVEPQNIAASPKTFASIDILDYIYAVLHSRLYREKYAEFLKIDFPRVPYPTDNETFWQLVELGSELRQIHLLESRGVEKFVTQYPIDGNNVVERINYRNEKVYINENQYFANVPESVWNFYIGGYQPAQKWLKDRKDRTLDFSDIQHYQKIIVALMETERLMNSIDSIVGFGA